MADNKKVVLTYDGLKKLEEELEDLKTVRRKDVAEKIKEARGQGDLSENAEYDAAKEEQGEIESRIAVIEKMLRNAEVIDDDEVSADIVTVGSKVKLWDVEFEEEIEYTIVGSAEADPMNTENGRISNESPVGKGLIGHKIGELVEIETPGGIVELKVLTISR
ncbi:MAG: transcription elongation factor GreA [Clostridiales bacterium]|nr:transcription elongation factor GreA [Clostridiales bacterium]